jgi:hypothetical protein
MLSGMVARDFEPIAGLSHLGRANIPKSKVPMA